MVKILHARTRGMFVFFIISVLLSYELLGIKLKRIIIIKFNIWNKKVCNSLKKAQVKKLKRN